MLFNDIAGYDAHEIGLVQVIEELMLKTTFDPLNLEYYTRGHKIEEDEEEEQELSMLASINEKSLTEFERVQYFPTSSSFEVSTSLHIPTSSRALSVAPFSSASIDSQAPMSLPLRRVISLNLDEANILPERMRRHRISRRQAYSASLIDEANGEISSYYAAFVVLLGVN